MKPSKSRFSVLKGAFILDVIVTHVIVTVGLAQLSFHGIKQEKNRAPFKKPAALFSAYLIISLITLAVSVSRTVYPYRRPVSPFISYSVKFTVFY